MHPESSFMRLEATVIGRVQGVGYRYFVLREAMAIGLEGWVANESDGSVRCVVEGPREELESLLERMQVGPGSAIVDRVSVAWMPATRTLGPFSVRSGAHRGD